jgi:hypothetical protein
MLESVAEYRAGSRGTITNHRKHVNIDRRRKGDRHSVSDQRTHH